MQLSADGIWKSKRHKGSSCQRGWELTVLQSGAALVQVLALLFTCCVTLDKCLELSASPFPLFPVGDHNPELTGKLCLVS